MFIGLGPNWNEIGNKTYYIIKSRKRISILPGLKVSYLACKCVFEIPEHDNGNR